MDYLVRFLLGGAIVSLFTVLGDVLRPKSFAGLFGAAPSVAIATLSLTLAKEGSAYVAAEAKAMIFGAAAFFVFAFLVCQLLMRCRISSLVATTTMLFAWFAVALGLKQMVLG